MSTEPLKICRQCSQPIVDSQRYKFCTAACTTAWHDAKKHTKAQPTAAAPTIPGRVCAFCSSPLAPGAHTLGNYCSDVCKRKAAEDDEDAKTAKIETAKPTTERKYKGTCKKCSTPISSKTLPVRRFCSPECRKDSFKTATMGPRRTKIVVEAAPSWHLRAIAVAKTLPSRLRRGLADVFKVAADKLS